MGGAWLTSSIRLLHTPGTIHRPGKSVNPRRFYMTIILAAILVIILARG